MTNTRFVLADEICKEFGICRLTLTRWIEAGKFPAPLRFGRKQVWLRAEFDSHIEQVAKSRTAERTAN